MLHITGMKDQGTVSIFNGQEELVKQAIAANQSTGINIKQLPAGIYYLHVEESNPVNPKRKTVSTIKFVKG